MGARRPPTARPTAAVAVLVAKHRRRLGSARSLVGHGDFPARTARERVVQANGGEQSRPPVPAVVGSLAVGAAETVTGIAVDEGRSLVRRRGSTPRSSSSTRSSATSRRCRGWMSSPRILPSKARHAGDPRGVGRGGLGPRERIRGRQNCFPHASVEAGCTALVNGQLPPRSSSAASIESTARRLARLVQHRCLCAWRGFSSSSRSGIKGRRSCGHRPGVSRRPLGRQMMKMVEKC